MNNVSLVGNLTKDPEIKRTSTDKVRCTFTVAVSREYKRDGDQQADFLPVVCWGPQAESCGQYLYKGSKVGVVGSIQTRSYEASDGTKRYVTEINARKVDFLTPRTNTQAPQQNGSYGSYTPPTARSDQGYQPSFADPGAAEAMSHGLYPTGPDEESDMPF